MSARPRRVAAQAVDMARQASIVAQSTTGVKRSRSKVKVEDGGETAARTPKRSKLSTTAKTAPTTPTKHIPNLIPTVPSPYRPTLLPPTLSFSLPSARAHLASVDPRFGVMFQHVPLKPFTPPLTAVDPFKTLVTSIIGQQVSWLAARAIGRRFVQLFGYAGAEEKEEEDGGFPSPAEVLSMDVGTLKGVGLSMRKAEYVLSLAEHFHTGQLSTELLRDGTDQEISDALIAVRGIGRWTVDMFLMFSLRRPDVLPVGDLGVQKGLLKWALAAHGALPRKVSKGGKLVEERKKKYTKTTVTMESTTQERRDAHSASTPPPEFGRTVQINGAPPTPITPGSSIPGSAFAIPLKSPHTPVASTPLTLPQLPPTPLSPGPVRQTIVLDAVHAQTTVPTPDEILHPDCLSEREREEWDAAKAVPLGGMSVETIRSRLAGKKVKGGAYLLPQEMEALTEHWKPYRSLGVYYMWPAGEDF